MNNDVEAERFVLRDAKGTTRALLQMRERGGVELVLFRSDGGPAVSMTVTGDDTSIVALYDAASIRFMASVHPESGEVQLALTTADQHKPISFIVHEDGRAGLELGDVNKFLHPEHLEHKAGAWLNTHIAKPCPVCGEGNFDVYPTFVQAPTPGVRDASIPLVVVTCRKCAHTMFFNARKMGMTFDE